MSTKHSVTFLPSGKTVSVSDGTTVLQACIDTEIHLEHACGGFCACTTCHVIIREGEENASEMSFEEEDKLDSCEGVTLRSRLGCQSKVKGDLTVEIPPTPY